MNMRAKIIGLRSGRWGINDQRNWWSLLTKPMQRNMVGEHIIWRKKQK